MSLSDAASRAGESHLLPLAAGVALPSELLGSVVTIGNFDGVHRGHAALVARARALAGELGDGVPTTALTFEPHPRALFRPDEPLFRLTPLPLKAELLAGLGIAATLVLPFDRELAATEAERFVDDILLARLKPCALVVGHDFHFGRSRGGTPALLAARAAAAGVPVEVVEAVAEDGEIVSSSRIRAALAQGDPATAARLLGRVWFVRAEVRHGDKRGRELGYPTANMHLPPDCGLRHGIYAVRIRIDGAWRDGVASFGRRPTFDDGAPRLETFVFDFAGDLYGRTVDVAPLAFLRGEEKFDSLPALIAQMDDDSRRARAVLAATAPFA